MNVRPPVTVLRAKFDRIFAMLRLLPMTERDKDAEILALRHQIAVLERQRLSS
jgi:hypothetical protein